MARIELAGQQASAAGRRRQVVPQCSSNLKRKQSFTPSVVRDMDSVRDSTNAHMVTENVCSRIGIHFLEWQLAWLRRVDAEAAEEMPQADQDEERAGYGMASEGTHTDKREKGLGTRL